MQDNVGTIVIGTKVDNRGMSKDIQKLYNQIEREQDKIERLTERKQQLDIDTSKYGAELDFAIQKTEELSQQLDEIAKTQLEINGMPQTIENIQKMKEELSSFNLEPTGDRMSAGWYSTHLQAEQFQQLEAEFDKYVSKIDDANSKLDLTERKYNRITSEIAKAEQNQIGLNQQLNEATSEKGKGLNIAGLEKGFGNIKDGFSTMLKKVLRIGMALVGVRTIINLITRSFNTLASYNEELGSKVEQMRLVLAVAFEPIINWLINALHVILSLINQIYSAVFSINLFGRASELWSKKMAKNFGGASASAKEIKKQLAGFDEMSVLQDPNASAGAGGGGGGGITPWTLEPTFDWGKIDIGQIVEKAKEIVRNLITGINTWLENVDPQELADGISTLIKGLLDMATMTFTEIDWQQLGKLLVETLSKMDWVGIIQSLINNIIGSLTWPIDLLIGWFDGLAEFFEQPDCLDKMMEAGITLVTALLEGLWTLITKLAELGLKLTEAWINLTVAIATKIWDLIKEYAPKIWEWLKGVFDKAWEWIKGLFQTMKDKFNDFVGKIKAIWEIVVWWFEQKINYIKGVFMLIINNIKEKIQNGVQWIKDKIQAIVDGIKDRIENIKTAFHNAVEWIKDKFNTVTNFFKEIGVKIGDFFSGAIKGAVNGVLSWVEDKVNWFIDKINGVINLINKIPGVSIGRLSRISLPRLATGGIINQPGRGVPVGNAIAGESGREGILPLTDKRAMEELGREIGKWISINATIPVNIGNRQIARVIQEINNDREFATNG